MVDSYEGWLRGIEGLSEMDEGWCREVEGIVDSDE